MISLESIPPIILIAFVVLSEIVHTYNAWYGHLPEKSRVPVHQRYIFIGTFLPPILCCVSGCLFWNVGNDSTAVYVSYYTTLSLACLARAVVPQFEQKKGSHAGRWMCMTSFLVLYGSLALSIQWSVDYQGYEIIPHCVAVMISSAYDLPFYILKPISDSAEEQLLSSGSIRAPTYTE